MTYQPYGQTAPSMPMYAPQRNFKVFGIAYMCLRGLVLVLFMILLAFAGAFISSLSGSQGAAGGPRGGASTSDLEAGLAIVFVVLLLWIGYVVGAGVMSIKGMIAGPIMGLVDAGLMTIVALLSLVGGEVTGAMCWLVPNAAIITLGVLAIKNRNGGPTPAYGRPMPQPAYAGQSATRMANWNPQFAPPHVQARVGQQVPQAPYAPQPQHAAPARPLAGEGTSAVVPSPKMAALGILVLAASVDPDISAQALVRARAVANKLLGPAAAPRIQRQLAAPVNIMDVDADLMQHTHLLNQQANDSMKANVIKAAEYVLKGPEGVVGLGEQFMATLKQQLGV